MPSWLLLSLSLLGMSAVVPLYVLGLTAGNWRAAGRAWGQFGMVIGALALPGLLVWCSFMVWPPQP